MQTHSTLPAPDPLGPAEALFCDLDGTLAPIAPRPQDVSMGADRRALLRRMSERLHGRLAILSGRAIGDVDRILDQAIVPMAGVHGLEHRSADGRVRRAAPSPGLVAARAALRAHVERNPTLLLEDKGLSLALHFRGAPALAAECLRLAQRLARSNALAVQPGDMLVELRTPGADKGDALRAFMTEAPFAGATPVFVGDDLTDEDAFVAARALGGTGVLVGSSRPSAASRRLADVEAVFAWIEASLTRSVTA